MRPSPQSCVRRACSSGQCVSDKPISASSRSIRMQALLSKATSILGAASEEKGHPAGLRTMALTADLVSLSLRLEADPGPDPHRVPLSDEELQTLSERLFHEAA